MSAKLACGGDSMKQLVGNSIAFVYYLLYCVWVERNLILQYNTRRKGREKDNK